MAGRDFALQGNVLICLAAAGAMLLVTRRAGAARVAAAAMSYEAEPAAMTLEEAGGDLEGLYQSLAASLKKEAEAALEKALAAMAAQMKGALETALAAVAEQGRKNMADASLAASPQGLRERLVLERGANQGAYLTIPVWYFPGSAALLIWLDGSLLAPEADYEEMGAYNESSNLIRLRRGLEPGAVLDFLVLPTPSSALAERSAKEAQAAQRQAAVMLAEAREAESQAGAAVQSAGDELALAQGWAKAAQKSAEEAWAASRNVYDMAAQVSIHARRPGVCAVKSREDIHGASPGLFIVNPHLTHAPTPFFGVWPAPCVHEMKWDGVFFMGGQRYPDEPTLPPKLPPRPVPALPVYGDGDDWIPCDHTHQKPPCGCPPPPPPCPGCGMKGEE